jgi:hypothetical protein
MGPRTGLDGCGKSRPSWDSVHGNRPGRSESLYRPSCPVPIPYQNTASSNGERSLHVSLFTQTNKLVLIIHIESLFMVTILGNM